MLDLSIIIPNWNGRAFLQRCVSAAVSSSQESGLSFEVLVMDDFSTDGSEMDAGSGISEVKVYRNERNLGFGETVNRGARLAQGKILILLNNDLIAKSEMVAKLCKPFSDDSVFGVSGKTVSWENREPNHVNMRGRIESGRFRLTWTDDSDLTETMFLQGGSCAVRRDLFLEFGGFCSLYAPGYWEDYDISYQALKAGFVNLYEPRALGYHLGQGSMIRAHGADKIERVRYRNSMLFTLLNFTDKDVLSKVLRGLPASIAREQNPRMLSRIRALGDVVLMVGAIQGERDSRSQYQKVRDAEVLGRFSHLGTLC